MHCNETFLVDCFLTSSSFVGLYFSTQGTSKSELPEVMVSQLAEDDPVESSLHNASKVTQGALTCRENIKREQKIEENVTRTKLAHILCRKGPDIILLTRCMALV